MNCRATHRLLLAASIAIAHVLLCAWPAFAQGVAKDDAPRQPAADNQVKVPDPAAEAAAIVAPFMTDATLFVWRIDQTVIDIDATMNKLMEYLKKHLAKDAADRDTLRRLQPIFDQLELDDMREVAKFLKVGGREVYILSNIASPALRGDPFVFIVRVAKGAKPNDVLKVMAEQDERFGQAVALGAAAVMNGHIVLAHPALLNQIDPKTKQRQKMLAAAFKAVEGDPVQLLFTPPAHAARAVEEIFPTLPESLGGGPSTVLTRGVRWAAFGLDMPPVLRLRAAIQSEDEAAAKAFATFSDQLLREYPLLADIAPLPKKIVDRLKLKRDGGRLTVTLSEEAIDAMIGDLLVAARDAGRRKNHRTSAFQLRAIHNGCILHSGLNDGEYPPSIGAMLKDSYFFADMTISPFDGGGVEDGVTRITIGAADDDEQAAWVNENTSYVYIPGLTRDADAKTIVLFEKPKPGMKQIVVCFNDNHVELLDLAEANKRIKAQTGFSVEQWSEVVSGERPQR